MKLYQELAGLVIAVENCSRANNLEWRGRHIDRVNQLVREYLPSGSGFDAGTTLDWDRSNGERLVFLTSFHHLNSESGMYDGWTDHQVIITASLFSGFNMRVTGHNQNDIKDYIADMFTNVLDLDMPKQQEEA